MEGGEQLGLGDEPFGKTWMSLNRPWGAFLRGCRSAGAKRRAKTKTKGLLLRSNGLVTSSDALVPSSFLLLLVRHLLLVAMHLLVALGDRIHRQKCFNRWAAFSRCRSSFELGALSAVDGPPVTADRSAVFVVQRSIIDWLGYICIYIYI